MMTTATAKTLSSNQLLEQYKITVDLIDDAWDASTSGDGNSESHLTAMNEYKHEEKVLAEEILQRKYAGTLYDGKYFQLVKLYKWAQSRCTETDPEKRAIHVYNMTRSAAMKKLGVYMLPHYYSGIFDKK